MDPLLWLFFFGAGTGVPGEATPSPTVKHPTALYLNAHDQALDLTPHEHSLDLLTRAHTLDFTGPG